MNPIRVLVVDDSAVLRRWLGDILAGTEGLEVVGTAASAEQALSKLEILKPDIITLDVEMPGTSGLELLLQIRKVQPRLPVVMFSSLTQRGCATTLEALARGATDYATKPTGSSRDDSVEHVKRDLVPKLLTLGRPVGRRSSKSQTFPKQTAPREALADNRAAESKPAEVLAIGCSTGGPNALIELFSQIPSTVPVPIVIVQHMPPIFTKLLAERLTALGGVPVSEAADGDLLQPGAALIAPGNFHMRVVTRAGVQRVALDQTPQVNSCRPAVDRLFESVAEVFGARALAMVLTGMGQDGLAGCQQIRARGGQVIVQDEATSIVWGMPGFVARAGLAQAILPLASLPAEVMSRIGRVRGSSGQVRTMEASNVR